MITGRAPPADRRGGRQGTLRGVMATAAGLVACLVAVPPSVLARPGMGGYANAATDNLAHTQASLAPVTQGPRHAGSIEAT